MSPLREIFSKYANGTTIDRENFTEFIKELEIQLNGDDINNIFNMLLIKDQTTVEYKDIRTFIKATLIYDASKYPTTPLQQKKKKKRKSYKVYPDTSTTLQTAKIQSSEMQ